MGIISERFELLQENKKLHKVIEKINDRIELYNDCYEGTPDECINKIKEYLKEICYTHTECT